MRPLAMPLLVGAVLVGCGPADDAPDAAGAGRRASLSVSAASSLTETFGEIGRDFAASEGGPVPTFSFDSSSGLALQIMEGAPADVFAAADEVAMDQVRDEGLLEAEPVVFARNELVLVTKPGNPTGLRGLEDLEGAGVVSLCGPQAACGRLSAQILERAGVDLDEARVTRGQNVKATLSAVSEGDAQAGLVFRSDALAAGADVSIVEVPAELGGSSDYSVAVLTDATHPDRARAFVDYVTGTRAQDLLRAAGFLPPPGEGDRG